MNIKTSCIVCAIGALFGSTSLAPAQTAAPTTGPTTRRAQNRPPMTEEDKAEVAKLADLPAWKPGDSDGTYFIGPDYMPAPEQTPKDGVPKGRVESFKIIAADSKFFPPTGLRGTSASRTITVYIPSQYVAGTPAPLIVSCDAYGAQNNQLPTILDNMIAAKRLPPIVAVMIPSGGGDGGGSERGLEYDTVSGKYAEFVEAEILPLVEKNYGVMITKDPDARMTLGGSSGASAAFTMAWFHPELYHRVISYSGTFVNQHPDETYPHGAWEYHENLIAKTDPKPLRVWMHVSERDNGATSAASGLHNWVIANIRMADLLKQKGYHYQFIYAHNAGHCDPKVIAQTYPEALEWVWQGYKSER